MKKTMAILFACLLLGGSLAGLLLPEQEIFPKGTAKFGKAAKMEPGCVVFRRIHQKI